jgi:hypothetical protein
LEADAGGVTSDYCSDQMTKKQKMVQSDMSELSDIGETSADDEDADAGSENKSAVAESRNGMDESADAMLESAVDKM